MPKAPKARKAGSASAASKPYDASKKSPEATRKDKDTSAKTKESKSEVDSYLLQVRLTNSEDPVITRLLIVPSNYTFATLHRVLQVAFGWAGCHQHSFAVWKILEEGDRPNFMTGRGEEILSLLHDDDMKDMYPNPDRIKKDSEYTLADIYDGEEYRGKVEVSYEYDHGDSWDHDITFLGRADPNLRKVMHIPDELEAVCIGGEGHPCAEDCGSSPGWEYLKSVFKKGKKDPEGLKDWYKNVCMNGDPKGLDPYKWDLLDVNDGLEKIKG